MNIEQLSDFFLYSALFNYAVLLFWFVMLCLAKDFVRRLHCTWFNIDAQQFDAIHYQLMGQYKLLIFIFNLSPWLVMLILF